jgi:hypothetical protein
MQFSKHLRKMPWVIIFIAIGVWACAPKQLLRIHYILPEKSDSLDGIEVSLSYKDSRENRALLGNGAAGALKDFSGNFALVVAHQNETEKLLGAFDLASMFMEVFKQRLQNTGIAVFENKNLEIGIELALKEFVLDLDSNRWVVRISYQTTLLKAGEVIESETVSGTAERFKVVGTREAEKVISDLLTDMTNKLDIEQLLRKAGLLSGFVIPPQLLRSDSANSLFYPNFRR